MSRFAVATSHAPLLNQPEFRQIFGGQDGSSLPLDEQGLLRPLEMVAPPGTRFEILCELENCILQVTTNEYLADPLYVDRRFLELLGKNPPERRKALPKPGLLLERLYSLLGNQYIWGGNYHLGTPELLDYYPPKRPIDSSLASKWTLAGVDCSGLLYQVTEGFTPRNTSALVNYGKSIPIAGKSSKEIAASLRPLDLLVWRGHMVIVFDQNSTIESRAGRGVVLDRLVDRIDEILLEKKPVDDWDSTTGSRFVAKRLFT